MKKTLISVLTLAIIAASLPVTALAADHSDPVTKKGERLKYNTPYYLKDKNLPDKGGVIVKPWFLDDFVHFAGVPTDNGTPIIFENNNKTDGLIKSGDWIRVKSTKVNSQSQYWTLDEMLDSVYLNYDTRTDHRIYGSSKDNSIGIGIHTIASGHRGARGAYIELSFRGYKGENTEKAWMRPDLYPISSEKDIQTPFEVIEVSE
ncbi:hypothetical protein [Bacillus sp. CDB3]|uniref:hypothetical protein n=1 Tax=Bacillus sp. CDB3 TaxID=360310 RepID=UPI0009D844D1|nr:hypothetical protein [Bacillus sp. CDB3]OQR53500.1 hypothetical protein CDB3_29460 [Bacillus sp. CDB3]